MRGDPLELRVDERTAELQETLDELTVAKEAAEGSNKTRTTTDAVLQNVRVLAIDQTFQTTEKGEQVVVGKTATLELKPNQAEVLARAESIGQLSLALRSLADNGDSALGDDGPILSKHYGKDSRVGTIMIYRYGIENSAAISQ